MRVKIDVGNNTITGTQNKFYCLWATGQNTEVTGNQLKINLQKNNSKTVIAYSEKNTLKDSTISSHGQNARGIWASEDATVTRHFLDIKVDSQAAKAVVAVDNLMIHIHDSYIQTMDKHYAILYSYKYSIGTQ
ncbi:hypothetical protein [Candidatus Williamhamiltonella defendens]|uniref:hypothetical protein n=1 Tax=Candidatus Williamhamiltonella defendens TaxID=138072 RepID=UPI00130DE284|nr:hypothetical protein [Candidatus Hamiltonella defensa]